MNNKNGSPVPLFGVVSYGRGVFTLYSQKGGEIVFHQDFDDGILFGLDIPIVRFDLAKQRDVLKCISGDVSPFSIPLEDGLKMFKEFNIPVLQGDPARQTIPSFLK